MQVLATSAGRPVAVGRNYRTVATSNGENVSDSETPETTTGGALGKVVGKAKEMVGKAIGEDDLAREGRLQQAQGEAETVAQRHSAQAKLSEAEQGVDAEKRENELERNDSRLTSPLRNASRKSSANGSGPSRRQTVGRGSGALQSSRTGRRRNRSPQQPCSGRPPIVPPTNRTWPASNERLAVPTPGPMRWTRRSTDGCTRDSENGGRHLAARVAAAARHDDGGVRPRGRQALGDDARARPRRRRAPWIRGPGPARRASPRGWSGAFDRSR